MRLLPSKGLRYWLLLLALVAIHIHSDGQTEPVRSRNVRYVDSIKHVVETYFCDSLVYPASYEKVEVKKMESLLAALNTLTANGLTGRQVNQAFSKVHASKRYVDTAYNGLDRIVNTEFVYKLGYVKIALLYVDSFLITARISLYPLTTVRCRRIGEKYLDFNFVENLYATELNFPFRLIDREYIYFRKFDLDNLRTVAARHEEYEFFSNYLADYPGGGNRTWLDSMAVAMYDPDSACCYSYLKGERHMVRMITENRIDLIRDLVFSPSYVYAVNAMEALEYLASIGKLSIDERTRQRICELKGSNDGLHLEHISDANRTLQGYKEVKDGDSLAVRKYRNSLGAGVTDKK